VQIKSRSWLEWVKGIEPSLSNGLNALAAARGTYFKRTGFRGGLNWYRNIDRNWELTGFLSGAKIRQPSLFVAGEFDVVITMYRQGFDSLEEAMPGLRKKVLVPGAGYWIQQERPTEVNDLLIEFLKSL
jgi:pimeloyl-ACP methyl ester carboxylesterase